MSRQIRVRDRVSNSKLRQAMKMACQISVEIALLTLLTKVRQSTKNWCRVSNWWRMDLTLASTLHYSSREETTRHRRVLKLSSLSRRVRDLRKNTIWGRKTTSMTSRSSHRWTMGAYHGVCRSWRLTRIGEHWHRRLLSSGRMIRRRGWCSNWWSSQRRVVPTWMIRAQYPSP